MLLVAGLESVSLPDNRSLPLILLLQVRRPGCRERRALCVGTEVGKRLLSWAPRISFTDASLHWEGVKCSILQVSSKV